MRATASAARTGGGADGRPIQDEAGRSVRGSATPSTLSPYAAWKPTRTARSVAGPKIPSTRPGESPALASRLCRSAPLPNRRCITPAPGIQRGDSGALRSASVLGLRSHQSSGRGRTGRRRLMLACGGRTDRRSAQARTRSSPTGSAARAPMASPWPCYTHCRGERTTPADAGRGAGEPAPCGSGGRPPHVLMRVVTVRWSCRAMFRVRIAAGMRECDRCRRQRHDGNHDPEQPSLRGAQNPRPECSEASSMHEPGSLCLCRTEGRWQQEGSTDALEERDMDFLPLGANGSGTPRESAQRSTEEPTNG